MFFFKKLQLNVILLIFIFNFAIPECVYAVYASNISLLPFLLMLLLLVVVMVERVALLLHSFFPFFC